MEALKTASKTTNAVSIGRQPVFDEKKRLWGYELFCVGRDLPDPVAPDDASVAVNVQSSAYASLHQIIDRGKHVIVDFNEKSILQDLPYALPPALATLRVAEDVCRTRSVMEALERLKSDGYQIMVDRFSGNPDCAALYGIANILSVETADSPEELLLEKLASARGFNASVLAARVQDQTRFRVCRQLGFSLFHGSFFKSPDYITVRKLSSNEVLRFQLLQFIESADCDFGRLAETIRADATISLRLLAFLNSAAFGVSQNVKSIPQAIALLGWHNVRKWLRVVLLTDMNQSKDQHELVLLSAQRGLFLGLLARDHDFWGLDPESVHLLGIFSLLDALMQLPMSEIVANLPIDNRMKAALCREAHNEYLPLLHVAQCLEEARWEDAENLILQLNLDGTKVRAAFQAAIDWSSELEALHSAKPA